MNQGGIKRHARQKTDDSSFKYVNLLRESIPLQQHRPGRLCRCAPQIWCQCLESCNSDLLLNCIVGLHAHKILLFLFLEEWLKLSRISKQMALSIWKIKYHCTDLMHVWDNLTFAKAFFFKKSNSLCAKILNNCLFHDEITTATLLTDEIYDTCGTLTSAQPAVSRILRKRNDTNIHSSSQVAWAAWLTLISNGALICLLSAQSGSVLLSAGEQCNSEYICNTCSQQGWRRRCLEKWI